MDVGGLYCSLLAQVTAQLWQLVVVHAELPAHLAALKNYFLLAKGDFYHSFLAEVCCFAEFHDNYCLHSMTSAICSVKMPLVAAIVCIICNHTA